MILQYPYAYINLSFVDFIFASELATTVSLYGCVHRVELTPRQLDRDY